MVSTAEVAETREHESASNRRASGWPSWAGWNGTGRRYTIGVEEELMLLDRSDHSPAQASDWVLDRLSSDLVGHLSPETHAAVVELTTGVHGHVAGAVAELAELRARLWAQLRSMGLCAASAGTYPLAGPNEVRVSSAQRYEAVAAEMRMLARREPTMALHVHIGVADPDDAIRLLNGLRDFVPVLVALSVNSPFCDGCDSGFASARALIFQGFPRTGTARRFADYADYVQTVNPLIASGALSDPTFLWWDVRMQPILGTVEIRVMDAQSAVADSAPLIALVQSLSRLVLEGDPLKYAMDPEVLAENGFLAARDGLDARLVDPVTCQLVPARPLLIRLLAKCRPHAAALGCSAELEQVARLAAVSGAERQRARARQAGLAGLIATLSAQFGAGELGQPAYPVPARGGALP